MNPDCVFPDAHPPWSKVPPNGRRPCRILGAVLIIRDGGINESRLRISRRPPTLVEGSSECIWAERSAAMREAAAAAEARGAAPSSRSGLRPALRRRGSIPPAGTGFLLGCVVDVIHSTIHVPVGTLPYSLQPFVVQIRRAGERFRGLAERV